MDNSYRVIRGGTWIDLPPNAWVTNRNRDAPSYRFDNLGLRLVRNMSVLEEITEGLNNG